MHEASHATACQIYSLPILTVNIDSDQPEYRRARLNTLQKLLQPDYLESCVVVCLAGGAGEKLFFGSILGDSGDLVQARQHLSRRFGPLEIGFQLARMRDAADALVRLEQQRIRRIADALLRHGSLTGQQITALV